MYDMLPRKAMRARQVAGRFAQARGSSAWAQAFNANLCSSNFARSHSVLFRQQTRLLASVNLSQCLGESPLCGFAEQYRAVASQSVTALGQSNTDTVEGDAEAQLATGTTADELEFVQIAEVPTLFTYCHQASHIRDHRRW